MATLTQTENRMRPLYIDGYTHQLSYAPGEEIAFNVSTSAGNYSLEIARIGATREVVWSQTEIPGAAHPIPADASSQGCGWPASFTLEVPETWQSGYYEGTLRATDGGGDVIYRNHRTAESTLFFIVRPAKPGANTPRFCYNSPPTPITPTTTGVASVSMAITEQAKYRETASRLIDPLAVSSATGNRRLSSGQNKTDIRLIMLRTPIWNFTLKCWNITNSC